MSKKAILEKKKIILDDKYIKKFKKRFITITIHTQGTNPKEDSITKIGAVKFEKGKEMQSFYEKFENNNEELVVKRFVDFLDDALEGKTGVYITGNFFDIDFICNLLEKYGYTGKIKYCIFTSFSRKYIKHIDEFTDFLNQNRDDYENNTLGNAKAYAHTLIKMIRE